MAETLCGSPLYMAPEVLHRRPYGPAADMWSLGVMLYQCLTGRLPYQAAGLVERALDLRSARTIAAGCAVAAVETPGYRRHRGQVASEEGALAAHGDRAFHGGGAAGLLEHEIPRGRA